MNTRNIAPLIDVRSLTNGRHSFAFAPTPAALDLDADLFSDIVVKVSASIGREAVVDVDVASTARLICSRTLVAFDDRISGSVRLIAVEDDGDVRSGDGDFLSDEPDFIVLDDGVLDLTTPIRDVILLAVPLRPVAPDAVDVEIRTTFGASVGEDEDDVDARWKALRALRSSDQVSEDGRTDE